MWLSSTELDPSWVSKHCNIACDKCVVRDISNASAPRSCFVLQFFPGNESLVLKQLPSSEDNQPLPHRVQLSVSLGLAREALFYSHFKESLGDIIPRVVYSHGDMKTGVKHVIMENLSDYVDSGILFGPGNPNNWNRDLPTLVKRAGDPVPTPAQVAHVTFQAYARLHARHWRDESLLKLPWLRGSQWVAGTEEGQKGFEGVQKFSHGLWAGKKDNLWEWDPQVLKAVENAVARFTWDGLRKELNTTDASHWCLVQGDCWPGNVMWHRTGVVKLVDWEMVGVGSGPQELGQYVISNMTPEDRRGCEATLVREYYDSLRKNGVPESFTFEMCWREYVYGGLARWLWFLCYYAAANDELTAKSGAFFHSQVSAFMKDHKVDPELVGPLRF
jgi:hypothetical protein